MKLASVIMMTAGLVLIYSSVKNKDPRDVVKQALKRK